MPHYLIRANYSVQGIQGAIKDGATSRAAAVDALVKSVGGTLHGCWWAFGDDDFIGIAEFPDNQAAMAVAATVGASGGASVKTTVLLTAAETDEALARRATYRAPGS